MSKIFKFIAAQWHDIKGNAKWDFIKLAAFGMIISPAAIIKFFGHASLLEMLIVLVVSTVCVAFLFCVLLCGIQKFKNGQQKEQAKPLKIKAIPCQLIIGDKYECSIEVENENPNNPAENVEVELLKIEPIPKDAGGEADLLLQFPIRLNSKSQNQAIINPKDSSRFLVFNIGQTSQQVECKIVGANTAQNIFIHDYLDFDKDDAIEYRISISASASHRTRAEKTFLLKFLTRASLPPPFTLSEII